MSQKLFGTNCGNCKYFTGKTAHAKLNDQGGVKITGAVLLKRAKEADLITLPGSQGPDDTRECEHKDVMQPVNDRMCCAYWDNDKARREWEK